MTRNSMIIAVLAVSIVGLLVFTVSFLGVMDDRILRLEGKTRNLEGEALILHETTTALRSELAKKTKEKDVLEQEYSLLAAGYKNAKEELKAKSDLVRQLQRDKRTMETDKKTLERTNRTLNGRVAQRERDVRRLQDENAKLARANRLLQQLNSKLEEAVKILKGDELQPDEEDRSQGETGGE